MNIVLLGAPGSGKGTQAAIVKKHYNLAHVSTGDILRAHIKEGTELGKKAKVFMDEGQLVSDELVIEMVKHRIVEEDCQNGFILDGFPRTVGQAEVLDVMLKEIGMSLKHAVYYNCPEELITERLGGRRVCKSCSATYHVINKPSKEEGVCDECGGELYIRDDDKPETIKQRLDVYNKTSEPLIDYYKKAGILLEIPADRSPEEVDEILEKELDKE